MNGTLLRFDPYQQHQQQQLDDETRAATAGTTTNADVAELYKLSALNVYVKYLGANEAFRWLQLEAERRLADWRRSVNFLLVLFALTTLLRSRLGRATLRLASRLISLVATRLRRRDEPPAASISASAGSDFAAKPAPTPAPASAQPRTPAPASTMDEPENSARLANNR